jgi:hypothetical protein
MLTVNGFHSVYQFCWNCKELAAICRPVPESLFLDWLVGAGYRCIRGACNHFEIVEELQRVR